MTLSQTKFVILFLDTFPSLHARRTLQLLYKPNDLGVLPTKRGGLYNGEVTLKTFEEMPYELKPGQMSFEAEKSKQSVNRDELKRRNNASAKKSRDLRRTREL